MSKAGDSCVVAGTPAPLTPGEHCCGTQTTDGSERVHNTRALDETNDRVTQQEKPYAVADDGFTVTCTSANTAYQVSATSITGRVCVLLSADDANSGIVRIGGPGTTTAGAAIPKSTQGKPVPIWIDPAQLYVVSSSAGDIVHVTILRG